ncbi:MAG: amidase family protein, partial [Actinomycetota bacterium]
ETERLVGEAAGVLESLGAEVVPLEMPSTQRIAGTAYLIIQLVEPLAAHEHHLRQRPHDYQPQTQALLALGAAWHGQHYVRSQRIRTTNIVEWLEIFDGIDAVLTPTTPRPAPPKEEAQASGVFDLVNYTSFFDFNGCPSISVPAGFTGAGLPVGLMLSAPPFAEARLLRIAHAYQEETGFNRHRPPLE